MTRPAFLEVDYGSVTDAEGLEWPCWSLYHPVTGQMLETWSGRPDIEAATGLYTVQDGSAGALHAVPWNAAAPLAQNIEAALRALYGLPMPSSYLVIKDAVA